MSESLWICRIKEVPEIGTLPLYPDFPGSPAVLLEWEQPLQWEPARGRIYVRFRVPLGPAEEATLRGRGARPLDEVAAFTPHQGGPRRSDGDRSVPAP